MNATHDTTAIYHGFYGSVFTPTTKGSGGAGSGGGLGGGSLIMKVYLVDVKLFYQES